MKILIATGLYPPEIGGPATYSKTLADELPERGFNVSVLPFSAARRFPKIIRHLAYFVAALKRCRGADLVFAQDPISVGLPAFLAARVARKKFFLRLGGDYAWEQAIQRYGITDTLDAFSKKEKGEYPLFVRLLASIQKRVARGAQKIVVPSLYLKGIVETWGIDPEKIKVVYNAFSPSISPGDKSAARRDLDVSGSVVVTAGRLVPWKGFAALIRTVRELAGKRPDLKLFIAGDGPELDTLKKLVRELSAESCVAFLGNLPQMQLGTYIQAADLFALNTGYEGFSHLILEVMAAGTPIITTPRGGNRELIEDGVNGILVEYNDQRGLGDALEKLLSDEPLRKQISQNAIKKASEFTRERMIRETIEILS